MRFRMAIVPEATFQTMSLTVVLVATVRISRVNDDLTTSFGMLGDYHWRVWKRYRLQEHSMVVVPRETWRLQKRCRLQWNSEAKF